MAYQKRTWQDRQVEFPIRRRLTPTTVDSVYDVTREEGEVAVDGDPFAASTMNDLEDRIESGLSERVPISGGVTLTGQLVAQDSGDMSKRVRNIQIGTEELTPGTSALTTGVIYLQYE